MALIWVKLPAVKAKSADNKLWMYYGNPTATAGDDIGGTYDTPQLARLHFSDPAQPGMDSTAYGHHAQLTNARQVDGLIGGAVAFVEGGSLLMPASPAITATRETGFTISAWVKIDVSQPLARLFEWTGSDGSVAVYIKDHAATVRYADATGALQEASVTPPLDFGVWHHIAMSGSVEGLRLYLDGKHVGQLSAMPATLDGAIRVGTGEDGGSPLVAQIDEFSVANTTRSDAWMAVSAASQSQGSTLLSLGEDGQQEAEAAGDESYFGTILRSVTVDGWVVIVILAIMAAISWVVMVSKGIVVRRVQQDNLAFLDHFEKLGRGEVDDLDREDIADDEDTDSSPLLQAMTGKHDHFQSSNIYRLYHAGVQEMHHRMAKSVGASATHFMLSPQAIDAIRATMDGAMVRESQKLNSQMVLLTIAISGGPFLGLLGTVVGVMITFAAIAASGDVNVNAIAPGIAAALVATVAGLAVAIPALFGYNYIGSRIKDTLADMRVFVDEFITKIAEQHS
jgi:biopolymer transport protein ExbB